MDKKIFAEAKGKVERYVGERRLRDAFALARSLSEGMANGVVSRELAGAEEGYRYMLEYAARGAEDPARDEMTRRFGSVVLDAVDRLDRDNRKADTPTYYFNTLRYEELQGEEYQSGVGGFIVQLRCVGYAFRRVPTHALRAGSVGAAHIQPCVGYPSVVSRRCRGAGRCLAVG